MKQYELLYEGKIISTNQAKSLYWRALKQKVNKLEKEFISIINSVDPPKLDKFVVEVEYWSRHDTDNIVFTVKVMIDQLVRAGKLKDDNKRYWRSLKITAVEGMKNNTILFKIKGVDAFK